MKASSDPAEILAAARKDGYPAGGQRAFVLAKVLQACEVMVVGCEHPTLVEDLMMIPATDMAEAFRLVERKHGTDVDVLVVPHALHTLPVVGGRSVSMASSPTRG